MKKPEEKHSHYISVLRGTLLVLMVMLNEVAFAAQSQLGQVIFDHVSASTQDSGYLNVTGRYDTTANISSLDINGFAASMHSGTWSVSVPQAEHYWVRLYASDGNYSTLEYAAPAALVESGLQLAIAERFLVEARAPLSKLLSNINLADLLHLGLERCAVDTNFLSGCDLYIDEIVAMSTPVIDELYFSPSDGEGITVNVRGSISNANLSGQLKRLIFGGYRKTTFDLKDLDFDVRFDIVPEHPASVRLETEQSDIELNIGSIRVVESNNLAAYLVPVFKEAIEFLLNQQLFLVVAGNYFEDLAVPLSAGIVGIDVNDDGQDDARYNVNADIQNLDVIGNGNLLANLSVSVTPLNPISDREILGYRVLGGEASPGEPDLPYADIEMKLNADFFSQLLAAAYQGGLEQALDIDLKVSDFGTFASQLTGLGLQLDTPVATSLAFGAPPEIVLGDPQADASKFMVLLPKTSLRIAAPFGAGEMELVSFVGDLYLDASVSPKGDGQLSIDFGNDILRIDISQVNGGVLYEQLSWLPEDVALGVLGGILPTIARQLKPAVNQLVNALARPDLDISKIMGDWFGVPFVAEISAKGSIQEIVQDQSGESLTLGVDISFTD